jgi:putative nucleotidyltransferase with HDIG domain
MVAHRYLSKPFSPSELTELLQHLCDTRNSAANERIRQYVGRIDSIPAISKTHLELTKALQSLSLPLADIGTIIERDPALTAKILQIVNSARFAPARRVTNVCDAVQLIGFDVVRAVAMSIQVFELCRSIAKTEVFKAVWEHSLATGFAAKRLAILENLPAEECDDAFMAGLLHDIGKVVLATSSTEYRLLWELHSADSQELHAREMEAFGACHAQVGAYLLRLWGLPENLVHLVEFHHQLAGAHITRFDPLLALHAAQELSPLRLVPHLDEALLGHLGLADRVPVWRILLNDESGRRTD